MVQKKANRYSAIFEKVFFDRYKNGDTSLAFARTDIEDAAANLKIKLPKNLGDVVYSFRYRNPLPEKILATQPDGKEWIIEGAGRAQYEFRLVTMSRILPRPDLKAIKIPDSTPEIIRAYAQGDEQALLAIVRYNRLLDIFLGISTYSLQNHWRTTIKNVGQIEIDEIYIGIDSRGCHYIIPVQAKGGNDQIGIVQTRQDLQCCAEKFPDLAVRAISAQFMEDEKIAMFEITIEDDEMKVVEERHYKLVPKSEIDHKDIINYRA